MTRIRSLLILLLVLPLVAVAQNAQTFTEGKHFRRVAESVLFDPTVVELIQEDPEKVQVIEFFSYGCHWCNRLEPYLHAWEQKPQEGVVFKRLPVVFNKTWRVYGKAYYTAQALGVKEKIHGHLFNAIHQKRNRLESESKMLDFFAKHGVEKEKFTQTYGSFSTNRSLKRAQKIARAYQLTAVPTIIVNGPKGSFLTSTSFAGGETNLIKVISFLIEKQKETKQG